jgi:D-lactate dehydrogenase
MIQQFSTQLINIINKKNIITDELLCYAYGTDASLYRMTPKLVLIVDHPSQVQKIIQLAAQYNIKLTFRAAGTSLSGQAVTDQVLVVLSHTSWQNYTIHNNGKQITVEPGIIGAHANSLLKAYGYKLGPDPASINTCKIGGIVANNSSGMCCGVKHNTYHTITSLKLILANGYNLDTGSYQSRQDFATLYPHIIAGINAIHEQIIKDSELVNLIAHRYRLKNTMGYSLNAFIDYTDPIDILEHLIVGSEGTLAFISEVSYETILDNTYKAVSLIYCSNLQDLVDLTLDLPTHEVAALELLDITALNSIKELKIAKAYLPNLTSDCAALLIEVSSNSELNLIAKIKLIQDIIVKRPIYHQIHFTTDLITYQEVWDIRKGIFPAIGAKRQEHTSTVIEDIAVDIIKLPELIYELRDLFVKYDYTDSAIFGHVLAGNIHFVFTPQFNTELEILRYKQFMAEMTKLVTRKFDGSLKAEHGTGRNMAPFVELEWGEKAYALMWQIKELLDPQNIFNPDVILSRNANIHAQNLKQFPVTSSAIIDKCIECGFCEPACPSKTVTLSPRGRIATYRYLHGLAPTSKHKHAKLTKAYAYYAIDTCATTGLCALSCPVGINTGEFILQLRNIKQTSSTWATRINKFWSKHTTWLIRQNKFKLYAANLIAKILGKNNTYKLSKQLKQFIPILPSYLPSLPNIQKAKFVNQTSKPNIADLNDNIPKKIIYVPSCSNRIFADSQVNFNPETALQQILLYLGYEIIYPENVTNLCCGLVFASKGASTLAQTKRTELINTLTSYNLPIMIDNSSCHWQLKHEHLAQLIDDVELIHANLNQLNLQPRYNKIALHLDCCSQKLNHKEQIMQILARCSHKVISPANISCCGFAGDLGFTHPEVNKSALHSLKNQITECDIGVTFNRNCQIGLNTYGEKPYLSLSEVVLNCLIN